MKRASVSVQCFLLFLVVFSGRINGQIPGFNKIRWDREKIAPGLIWKSAHTVINDSVPQNINVLIVNTQKRVLTISYNPEKNNPASTQAENAGALAAVNAGFFNIREGGSVTYIRTGGIIVDSDTAKKWARNSNMTGSVMAGKNGDITIDKAYPNNWYDSHPEYPEVLVTGPLLVKDKFKKQLPASSLVVNKHPRTVIGLRGSHKVILVTLDGRSDQAAGMTLNEVADLMVSLNCKDAVNLDGGGSTTMWITGKPEKGVVNMPSDNKKFDHAGERAVSDILIIK